MERITKDNFLLIGISHKTAPVEIREQFSLNAEQLPVVLTDISHNKIPGIKECVVLSTCNRTEIYALITRPLQEVIEKIKQYIVEISGKGNDFLDYFYTVTGEQVVEHLLEVTSGIDSMILGEPQIFGQVKDAYASACDYRCTGPAFNRLFHHAFQVGKLIRSTTSIGKGAISISSAAVTLAKKTFSSIEKRSVLMIGAGKIGELCAKQLIESGIARLYITNRTIERANILANELSGKAVPFDDMETLYEKVDIIITSVTSCEPLITKKCLMKYHTLRNGKPLCLIDLGVPRNIEPKAAEIEHIYLFNIDNLEDLTADNREKREKEVSKARKIIIKEVNKYFTWIKEREVIPIINNLREKCENIRLEELDKIKNRVSSETYKMLNQVTRRIVRKMLHNPTIAVRSSESEETRKRLLHSIHELFIKDSDN